MKPARWRDTQYDSTVRRLFQDDLASVSISRLRASGVVTSDTKSVYIVFGEGDDGLRREVEVVHRHFPNGGEWSFFSCPVCSRPARVLKLHASPCVGAAVSAKGLDIAYPAARPSSATSRGWRGFISCASYSMAGRRDCIRGQAVSWTADGRLPFRGEGE
jgi:hypothetical protein